MVAAMTRVDVLLPGAISGSGKDFVDDLLSGSKEAGKDFVDALLPGAIRGSGQDFVDVLLRGAVRDTKPNGRIIFL